MWTLCAFGSSAVSAVHTRAHPCSNNGKEGPPCRTGESARRYEEKRRKNRTSPGTGRAEWYIAVSLTTLNVVPKLRVTTLRRKNGRRRWRFRSSSNREKPGQGYLYGCSRYCPPTVVFLSHALAHRVNDDAFDFNELYALRFSPRLSSFLAFFRVHAPVDDGKCDVAVRRSRFDLAWFRRIPRKTYRRFPRKVSGDWAGTVLHSKRFFVLYFFFCFFVWDDRKRDKDEISKKQLETSVRKGKTHSLSKSQWILTISGLWNFRIRSFSQFWNLCF